MPRLDPERITEFAAGALSRFGVPDNDARLVAETLIEAELQGQSSHGLMRLPLLLRRLDAGWINPRPRLRVAGGRSAAALLDGDNGLGAVVGARAAEVAVERAQAYGVGVVAARHSNHLGALGFYVRRICGQGMAGLAFSNSAPAMAPPGGRRAYLGTNPIAAAFPTSGEPVVVDMATSQVARGRILNAARATEPIPEGWAVDAKGRPTTDPQAAIQGSLTPLGGDKGFALALVVEALSGVLPGAAMGPEVGGTYVAAEKLSDVGHCFVALDPEAFAPGFAERMDRLATGVKEFGGRVPGERRLAERARRRAGGLDVPEPLVHELSELAGVRLL